MSKRESRLLRAVGTDWMVVLSYPFDYDPSELVDAVGDGTAKVLAVKGISGPMDQRYWMSLELVKLDTTQQNRYNNYKIMETPVEDSILLQWVDKARMGMPVVSKVTVSKLQYPIEEKDGKSFIRLTKKCISCGLEIKGTCAVSKKDDGTPGNVQMFVPDPEFKGAMPSKPKSKLWLCSEHSVSSASDVVKEQYAGKAGVTIPPPRKIKAAIVTPGELKDALEHVKELNILVRELKKEMKGLLSIKQIEDRFWELVGSTHTDNLAGMALLVKALKVLKEK